MKLWWVLIILAASLTLGLGASFLFRKPQTIPQINKNTNIQTFEPKFGEHFIVGYSDPEKMKELIRGGVGGVFVGQRNAQGKTLKELREEIDSFLEIRPDLFIATDQEGGVVQKLSPPLPKRPKEYAASIAADLRSVGVNVNLAPVVDLDPKKKYKNDKFTKIYQRAISDDPQKVIEVARVYINSMKARGIIPVIKHFPGLRLAKGDTHLQPVTMEVDREELEKTDWVPFRALLDEEVWLMVSHVKVPNLDTMKVIRDEWRFEGIVVSDDFSMGGAGDIVEALNSGVDIILVSENPEVYFDKIYDADKEKLKQSEARIRKARRRV